MSIDQIVLLGGVSGYMGVYRGNAFTPINLPNFPITEKTRTSEQILRYASLVLGPTLSQRRGVCLTLRARCSLLLFDILRG